MTLNAFSNYKNQKDFTKDDRFQNLRQYFSFTNIENYASDFGGIISQIPLAVFKPRTLENLQLFLQIANEYKVKITCRGKGNSAYGQSQVKDGIIIDLNNLDTSIKFNSDDNSSVTVPAFKTWFELIEFIQNKNKTVHVTIDNLDLTIGGTLSFGALAGTSYLYGSGADNVVNLEVMTLDGKIHTCSKTHNSELFNAALCGMGQFGIIINVTIPLIEANKKVNLYNLCYDNVNQFIKEQKTLYESKVFNHLKGYARKNGSSWEYVIEAGTYYDENEDPSIAVQLQKLSPKNNTMQPQSMPYYDFVNMVTGFVNELRKSDKLSAPHPWYNVLIPEDDIINHLAKVLDTPHFTGTEPILIYPLNSDHFQRPLFVKPDCQTFYLLGALYNTSFQASVDFPYKKILDRNLELYLEAKDKGGCRYPVDAIPFSPEIWSKHYGEKWHDFCELKQKYDPSNLLSEGLNISIDYDKKNKQVKKIKN